MTSPSHRVHLPTFLAIVLLASIFRAGVAAPEACISRDGVWFVEMAKKMAAAAEKSYEKGQSSPVSVITRVLSKAVRAKRPKTRYAAGYMAKPTIFLRKILPDRWFDKLILSAT